MTGTQARDNDFMSQFDHHLPLDKFYCPQDEILASSTDDWMQQLEKALEAPKNYPPLKQSIFPGDQVCVVLQEELPQPESVLKVLLEQLLKVEVEPADICVLVTQQTATELGVPSGDSDPHSDTEFEFGDDDSFHAVRFAVHDPEDEHANSYLAANEAGQPVMINRLVVDADVVIPVGFPVTRTSGEISTVDHAIYPGFGDTAAQARFHDVATGAKDVSKSKRRGLDGETRLVNENLSAFFAVQLVPGPGHSIVSVFAGNRADVCELAQSAGDKVWSIPRQPENDLALVSMEGASGNQTWADFSKALIVANRVANSSGPIVVWSNLSENPPAEIRRACNAEFSDETKKLSEQMREVAAIVGERGVYLKCNLPQSIIEELALGFVSKVEDLSRMLAGINDGVLIRDAHRCNVKLERADVK